MVVQEDPSMKSRGTLLEKFAIPIQHLDFDYVEKCSDAKHLERILRILQSGEEGYYPDLMKATENRLSVIKPTSKYLRCACPVVQKQCLPKNEQIQLDQDLRGWLTSVNEYDAGLDMSRKKNPPIESHLPIRQRVEIIDGANKSQVKRISSTDYKCWDKYDPDTELLKMDLKEEGIKRLAVERSKKKKSNKIVQFKEFNTETEALQAALGEKDKGNEFYKAGDYSEALRYYTTSINIQPTLQCYTNRALIHLKLNKYREALNDSNAAIAIEPNNVKAHVRRAQACEGLNENERGLESAERAVELDPNNVIAQTLTKKFRELCGIFFKNKRMVIEEVTAEKTQLKHIPRRSKEDNYVTISIPGPSNMRPPHYIICARDDTVRIREATLRANCITRAKQMSIDPPPDDQIDDSCPINHLASNCTFNRCEKTTSEANPELAERKLVRNDKLAGGEPQSGRDDLVDIRSPYSFLQCWQSVNDDVTLQKCASILKNVDATRITEVIGLKMDNAMLSTMLRCLCAHFAVPGEIETLHSILENIVRLPRFDIISMLSSKEDAGNIKLLIDFLNQHDRMLSESALNKLCNC